MNGFRQGWYVAVREMGERLRSPVYYLSLALMVIVVASSIILPAVLDDGTDRRDVGMAGFSPPGLARTVEARGDAVEVDIRIRTYDSVADGERAVRNGDVDVLVVDAGRLEWQRRADGQLQTIVTSAIQVVSIQQRATAAGISPAELSALVAPVAIENVEVGRVAGRSADDESAAYLISLVLFFAVSSYGGMVLGGVVEEKSSRVVEVLLARIPARSLLAGKIAGIGLLGLAQVVVTGLVALTAIAATDLADIPAARGSVIAWAVVWFVLGYALIATAFGALGSLASRSEDASSLTTPLVVVLIAGYFVSLSAIGSPDTWWARLASWFPATAPFAMPNRIAMGATTWWDPYLAVVLALLAIAGLVVLGGRIYSHAVLHTGGVLRLAEAWRGSTTGAAAAPTAPGRREQVAAVAVAAAAGAVTIALSGDVVIGIAVAAGSYAVATRLVKARHGPAHRE
jgi:ABC-2 type transport system permease protein